MKAFLPTLAALGFLAATPASAFQVYGAIGEKWKQLKAEAGPLGGPRSDERKAAGDGRYNEFQHGYIYWQPKHGAFAVYGAIGEKWNQMGRERNFGFPVTDERSAPRGGRFNDFENGGSIYWQTKLGAHAIYGVIRQKWLQLGGVAACGYPTSDEYQRGNSRTSDFERRQVRWSKQLGVRYTGCAKLANPEVIPAER